MDTVSPDMRARIQDELDRIAQTGVRILFAVESGSRAWGFPSPDSDYDVRFVYARPLDWYLSLTPGRDVIERPISDLLDIGGWDIRKALALLIKPNPVLLEWLSSPIRYRWTPEADRIAALAGRATHGTACHHHYANLAKTHFARCGEGAEVPVKRFFYTLRPALALMWIAARPEPPPMDLPTLAAGRALSGEARADIDRLVALKRDAREVAEVPRMPRLDALIAEALALPAPTGARPDVTDPATALLRAILRDQPSASGGSSVSTR